MYLKTIEIVGFKSFADKTRIELKPGITGVIGPNGCGKCVHGDTLVQLADGSLRRIGSLVEEKLSDPRSRTEKWDDGWCVYGSPGAPEILSLNPETLRIEARPILAFVKRKGPEELFRIRTRSGREIAATHYHPFFTLTEGRLRTLKAEELVPGMPLAMPRRLPVAGAEVPLEASDILGLFQEGDSVYAPEMGGWNATRGARQSARATTLLEAAPPEALERVRSLRSARGGEIRLPATLDGGLARFLGYLISEGRTTRSNQAWFVNSDEEVVREYRRAALASFGTEVFVAAYKPSAKDCLIFSKALCLYLERVFGMRVEGKSATKRVPDLVFRSPDPVVREFLSGLFEGDGCLRIDASQGKTSAYWEYSTASRELAEGVAALLGRFGLFPLLRSRLKAATNTAEKTRRTYHSVLVYGLENAQKLAGLLRFVGKKRLAVERLLAMRACSNPNRDLVPGIAGRLKAAARSAGLRVKPLRRGHPRLSAYVEGRCQASRAGLAEAVGLLRSAPDADRARADIRDLEALASSEAYWDEIESAEKVPGPEWVYDLCVDETHNFVAGGFFVHNSNIMEAVRWCIGEMSWKSLRSDAMVNVIFAGTSRRNPLSMAEVTLTFDNAQSMLPVQYSEVSVTRRIFRSGESEYWMNRTQCRLKDIRELFLDTGIGSGGYAIIDQGDVDFVMRAKPEDRRSLFEEAAGVSKYKAKREEALRKLERVEADLFRLLDSTALIDQQIKKLEADARKAQLCQKYKTELSALETRQIVEEAAALDEERTRKHEEAAPLLARVAELKVAVEAEEGRLAALNLEKTHQESAVIELNGRIASLKARVQSLGSRREYAEQARRDASKELLDSAPLLEAERRRAAEMDPVIERARQDAGAAASALAGLRAESGAFESELSELMGRLDLALRQLDSLKSQGLAAARRQLETSRRESAAQSTHGQLEFLASQTLKTLDRKEADCVRSHEDCARWKKSFTEQEAGAAAARGALEGLRERREAARLRAAEAVCAERSQREEEFRLMAHIEALELEGGGDPYWTGAQAACASGIPGVLGTVQSILRAPPSVRPLVEDALGDRLHAVLCETLSCAEAVVRFLQDSGKGRARLLILSSLPESEEASPAPPPRAKPLLGLLEFDPAHAKAVRHLLREAYSLDGSFYGDHWVCGGAAQSRDSKPRLSDLEPMRRSLADARARRAAAAEARARAEEELSALGAEEETRGRELAQEEARLDEASKRLGESEGLAQSLGEEASLLRAEAAAHLSGIAEAKERILALREELAACREEARHFEEAQDAAPAQALELKEQAAGRRARAEDFKRSLDLMECQERVLRDNVERQEALRGSFEEQARARARRQIELQERIDECTADLAECKAGLDAAHRDLAGLENEAQGEDARLKSMRMSAESLELALRDKRSESERTGSKAQALEVEISGLLARREALEERLRSEWRLSLEEARARAGSGAQAPREEGSAADPEASGGTRERVQWLRRRIDELGNVNMGAPEEYAELKGKRDYIQGQMDDLNKAKSDLHAAINKINATTRENFRQTFTEVREHFRRIYGVLFDGGEADLLLTDQENMLETGVEIVAQPPGKRLQSISLLSGGEKALTAISLLFAFFMVRPSPMCMLDEADAALDEANVDRFSALLKEFTGKSQFLIVSHNKKTMEACDAIYGVTMEESGVTQLVSVDFRKKSPEGASADEASAGDAAPVAA